MRECAGIVLAGGRSTRMGTPKAALPWGGTTLLAHVCEVLAAALGTAVVVVRAPGQELPPLPAAVEVADDPVEGRGPLQGIAAGLAVVAPRAQAAYVSATDVPLLSPAFVRCVVAALDDATDVALPVTGGHHQPLAAAYRTSLVPLLASLLAQDIRRPAELFARCRVRELHEDDLPDLASLRSANDREEYARLVAETHLHPETRELLAWIAARPRSYDETLDVWRTSCPRHSLWEDAQLAGLVRVRPGAGEGGVSLTPLGQAVLRQAAYASS
jgi:molybdopterin-guanine dinucleotide biosynthesis protein A